MIGEQVLVSTVFIAGLLSFFAPCILPLLPVYFSVLSSDLEGAKEHRSFLSLGKLRINLYLVYKTMIFVAGLSTSFIILGFGAGALGAFINTQWFLRICGLLVVLLGLHQIGLFHLSFLEQDKKIHLKRSAKQDILGTYLLGLTFSFGWTPCIGPILGAVLGITASKGQAAYGGLLMFIYSLGLLIPFLILSIFSNLLLQHVKKLTKHLRKIQILGGIIIVIMGILLMTNNLNFFVSLINTEKVSEDSMDQKDYVADSSLGQSDIKNMSNEGVKAPEFELLDLTGTSHKLSDYAGKKVYIKFWASWCPICLAGLAELNTLDGGEDYVVLTLVSPGYKSEKKSEDFITWFAGVENVSNITVLLDEGGALSQEFGIRGYPTSAFIGSDGILAKLQPGHLSNEDITYAFESIY
jgi:cytochrome c-type biogenesis protein